MAFGIIGILIGYLPMILFFLLVPGFEGSFFEKILTVFRIGTNLPLPIPWPWNANINLGIIQTLNAVILGLFFIILPTYYLISMIYLFFIKGKNLEGESLFTATIFVGIIYMYYAFSRADLSHLAHSMPPFIISILTLPVVFKYKYNSLLWLGILTIFSIMTFFTVGMINPFYFKITAPAGSLTTIDINGDSLCVDTGTAQIIKVVKNFKERNIKVNEELFIAPHWPGFYPILKLKSPVKNTYLLFEATETQQKDMVIELEKKKVNWVILGDILLDGRDDLRFRNTHKIVWSYIMSKFEVVSVDGLPSNYQLLHRKTL
jgi:hypothetical protein